MKRHQFSIFSLFCAVTLTGLGCAALVNASPRWAMAMVSLTLIALVTATLGAVYLRSRARTWCGGFAICGWAYLLITATSLFDLEQYTFTAEVNDRIFSLLNGEHGTPTTLTLPNDVQSIGAFTFYASGQSYKIGATGSMDHGAFDRIGHSLWAILAGVLGAAMASYFAGRNKEAIGTDAETRR